MSIKNAGNEMKCGLFNDPVDNYGHILHIWGQETVIDRFLGDGPRGWVGDETMKNDTFLRSAPNP